MATVPPPPVRRHRFSLEDYHRMLEAGILGEEDRVELIEGELVEMTPIGTDHAATVDAIVDALRFEVPRNCLIRVQSPVSLPPGSEPQPDLTVVRKRSYRDSHPGPEDVLLLIEVADTSAGYDREVKIPLYARYGIPEVWLVDLQKGQIEVYREPAPGGYYRECRIHRAGEPIRPLQLPDLALDPKLVLEA